MRNDLAVKLKLMGPISMPLSIQIIIEQHMRLQGSLMYHIHALKKVKQVGYVKKLDLWIPHQLREIQLIHRMSICISLLKHNEIDPFLKRLITGD
ncbi:hypothetical protein CDAR_226621 [Caerostris darwini]|uniref:Uncharacterized protein n=1 Tax=Caerostris darwini TaxID=1538125 RepID=A0AAV4PUM5_9ARAC|nr:hypothetical protein CDAR_226621 [Caerostris darwini]